MVPPRLAEAGARSSRPDWPRRADMPTRTGWGLLVAGALFVVSGRLFGAIEFLVIDERIKGHVPFDSAFA